MHHAQDKAGRTNTPRSAVNIFSGLTVLQGTERLPVRPGRHSRRSVPNQAA